MNVSVTGPFIYFTIPIFGGINVTQTMLSSAVVTLLLCVCFVQLGKGLPDARCWWKRASPCSTI